MIFVLAIHSLSSIIECVQEPPDEEFGVSLISLPTRGGVRYNLLQRKDGRPIDHG